MSCHLKDKISECGEMRTHPDGLDGGRPAIQGEADVEGMDVACTLL